MIHVSPPPHEVLNHREILQHYNQPAISVHDLLLPNRNAAIFRIRLLTCATSSTANFHVLGILSVRSVQRPALPCKRRSCNRYSAISWTE